MIVYSQSGKAERFKQLHESPLIFVIPNLGDMSPAKSLSEQGHRALVTTCAELAYSKYLNDRV
jgi:2-methylisocitrate lyase-like PEP mutase family enzyme